MSGENENHVKEIQKETGSYSTITAPSRPVSRMMATGMVETVVRKDKTNRNLRNQNQIILQCPHQNQNNIEKENSEDKMSERDDSSLVLVENKGNCNAWALRLPHMWSHDLPNQVSLSVSDGNEIQGMRKCNNSHQTSKTSSDSISELRTDYDEEECVEMGGKRESPRYLDFSNRDHSFKRTTTRNKRKRKRRQKTETENTSDALMNFPLPYQIGIAISFTITILGLISMFVYFLVQAISMK